MKVEINRGIEDLRFNKTGEYCDESPKSHAHLPPVEQPHCAREDNHPENHKLKVNQVEALEWE